MGARHGRERRSDGEGLAWRRPSDEGSPVRPPPVGEPCLRCALHHGCPRADAVLRVTLAYDYDYDDQPSPPPDPTAGGIGREWGKELLDPTLQYRAHGSLSPTVQAAAARQYLVGGIETSRLGYFGLFSGLWRRRRLLERQLRRWKFHIGWLLRN
jgi:hypothetical protein